MLISLKLALASFRSGFNASKARVFNKWSMVLPFLANLVGKITAPMVLSLVFLPYILLGSIALPIFGVNFVLNLGINFLTTVTNYFIGLYNLPDELAGYYGREEILATGIDPYGSLTAIGLMHQYILPRVLLKTLISSPLEALMLTGKLLLISPFEILFTSIEHAATTAVNSLQPMMNSNEFKTLCSPWEYFFGPLNGATPAPPQQPVQAGVTTAAAATAAQPQASTTATQPARTNEITERQADGLFNLYGLLGSSTGSAAPSAASTSERPQFAGYRPHFPL